MHETLQYITERRRAWESQHDVFYTHIRTGLHMVHALTGATTSHVESLELCMSTIGGFLVYPMNIVIKPARIHTYILYMSVALHHVSNA